MYEFPYEIWELGGMLEYRNYFYLKTIFKFFESFSLSNS